MKQKLNKNPHLYPMHYLTKRTLFDTKVTLSVPSKQNNTRHYFKVFLGNTIIYIIIFNTKQI